MKLMEDAAQEQEKSSLPPVSNTEIAINHFRQEMALGKHWYIALLESIGLWTDESEEVEGRSYRYLVDGEAFDWLLLAERLCDTANGGIPLKEKNGLLFESKPPLELDADAFKRLIGDSKYHQYLNYFYGVTVEEALLQAIREEVRKERHSSGVGHQPQAEEGESFFRVYSETESVLLKQFRKEKHYSQYAKFNLTQIKEFIYWRFKYRLRTAEKARVASDTQKALKWLKNNGAPYQN
jgi:hypothetical protein